VIVGESGGGNSALLANWSHAWSQEHPETPLLVHFIGAAPDSADWMVTKTPRRDVLGISIPQWKLIDFHA
jgi:hypothetical protein